MTRQSPEAVFTILFLSLSVLAMIFRIDAVDGPVVRAAREAIDAVNVLHVLPWVPAHTEEEVRKAFEDVMHAREKHPDAAVVADRWFFETVVRLHCLGEGRVYTGLRPPSVPACPALSLAVEALETGDCDDLAGLFGQAIGSELRSLLNRCCDPGEVDLRDTPAARERIRNRLVFLHFVDELDEFLSSCRQARTERDAAVRARLQRFIGLPFYRRHPATAEAVAHHS